MSENRCLMCGEVVPEGRMVCPRCEAKALNDKQPRSYSFTIHGEPATKKNSAQIVVNPNTGRPFITPSKRYKQWASYCKKYILSWKNKPESPINYPVILTYTFHMPTRRAVDDLNLSEAMDDILTECGILRDDCRDIVVGHDGTRVYYDKENPRVCILITEVPNYKQWKEW